eukprot:jgi/Antlo1/671/1190
MKKTTMSYCILLVQAVSAHLCSLDRDCWSKSRPDIHSLYCVNSRCQRILAPGMHCTRPEDCSSFFYFGPLACSAKCKVENECEHLDIRNLVSRYCCRPVPENGECLPHRPNLLTGCGLNQSCVMDLNSRFICSSGNPNSWLYGVFLSITGNMCINIGINMQKKSYTVKCFEFLGIAADTFMFGAVMYSLGKILSFAAYIFGNQSLLASLSAFGLIANSMFAPLINQEVFTWKDFVAIFLVLTGSSVIVMYSGRSERAFSLCELLKMYTKAETLTWFAFLLLSMAAFYLLIKYVEVNSDWGVPDDLFSVFCREGIFFEENSYMLRYFMLIFYVGLSALIAAFTSLFAKSFGEMVEKTMSGDNQFLFGVTYVFFILLVSFTFWQIYWLNRALRHYDALLTLPVFHAMWTILSIFNAGIYFSDFEHFSRQQVVGFVSGLCTIFAGSFFLGLRVHDKDKTEATAVNLDIETVKKDA